MFLDQASRSAALLCDGRRVGLRYGGGVFLCVKGPLRPLPGSSACVVEMQTGG